jgi:iron-sulfur cluster assembly protein
MKKVTEDISSAATAITRLKVVSSMIGCQVLAKIQANGLLSRIRKLHPAFVFIFADNLEKMTVSATNPITLTEGAIIEIKKLMQKESHDPSQLLRIGVKGGGCSGMSYLMGFDYPTEKDFEFEIAGIRCIMNKAHEMYLLGIEIDWQDGLNNRGFVFKNPNASTTCGCGSSFAV